MPYELLYGTVHCTGRITYVAGTVATKDDAMRWCSGKDENRGRNTRIPETDPLRWCPVRHCHMKRQRPWRSYRETPDAGAESTAGEAGRESR